MQKALGNLPLPPFLEDSHPAVFLAPTLHLCLLTSSVLTLALGRPFASLLLGSQFPEAHIFVSLSFSLFGGGTSPRSLLILWVGDIFTEQIYA